MFEVTEIDYDRHLLTVSINGKPVVDVGPAWYDTSWDSNAKPRWMTRDEADFVFCMYVRSRIGVATLSEAIVDHSLSL